VAALVAASAPVAHAAAAGRAVPAATVDRAAKYCSSGRPHKQSDERVCTDLAAPMAVYPGVKNSPLGQ